MHLKGYTYIYFELAIHKDSEHRNIKDLLINKMYFCRIPASAITLHGFAIIFNFITTTAVAYVPKMGDPVPACTITGQANPSLPNDKHCNERFGFTNSGFSKSL